MALRYLLLLALTAVLAGTSCSPTTQTSATPDMPIDSLFQHYYEEGLKLYPFHATSEGDGRYNHLFYNDLTQEFKQRERDFYSYYLDQLKRYDPASLSEQQRTSYDVLQWDCSIALEGLDFPSERMPMSQTGSTPMFLAQMASGESIQPFESVEDYDNWLARLKTFPEWCDTAIATMTLGIETGYVLPRVLIEKMIPQFTSFIDGPVEQHLYYQPIANLPADFPEADKARLTEAYTSMIESQIMPSYKKLHDFLTGTYLPAGRSTHGIGELPRGKEWYDYYIKYYTTTTMNADAIFDLGKKEVKRIRKEMEVVKEEMGFEGSLTEFFDFMRDNPALTPYTDPQQIIDYFNGIYEKMKPELPKLFDKVPKSAFEIRRTEAFREASASWEYRQPSKDGSRPGIFYVPIPDVRKYNMYSDDNTFLHEAIPGHHYQIALQQENESLPDFRKTIWYSAYGEGWALYTESLGKDLGLYADPIQYFGALSWDMHRAIRLVVDVGMHVKGWTREEAIQYSLENEAEPEHTIISEIERYMAGPGQALSYKIGQLKIIEMRQQAKEVMGEAFDIREFHNQILEPGCVPLSTLEKLIDRWIAEEEHED